MGVHGETGQRVLPVEGPKLLVDCRIHLQHSARSLEEGLAEHGEEFPRRLRGVRIDLGAFVGVHARAEVVEQVLQAACKPALDRVRGYIVSAMCHTLGR